MTFGDRNRCPMDISPKTIQRYELLKKLVRAAQVRSIVTMLSVLPSLLIVGAFLGESLDKGVWPLVAVFGGPTIVGWLMTKFYCHPAVICPSCGHGLWECGTGNFKPRRMKIREGVRECPSCHIPIV